MSSGKKIKNIWFKELAFKVKVLKIIQMLLEKLVEKIIKFPKNFTAKTKLRLQICLWRYQMKNNFLIRLQIQGYILLLTIQIKKILGFFMINGIFQTMFIFAFNSILKTLKFVCLL